MADITVDVNLPNAISVDVTSPTQVLATNVSIPGPQGPRGEKGNSTSINSLTADNIIITGADGNIVYNSGTSTIFISGNSGYFQSAVNSLTTNLNSTGANLNTSINNLSGLFTGYTGNLDNNYATDAQLANTGSTLNTKIDNLSGHVNSQDSNISNNLASTGSSLQSNINTLSSNLSLTGSNLENKINSLSGTLTGNYATITNLANTGSTLNTKINNLSGDSVLTYKNQTINGQKTFTEDLVVQKSGFFWSGIKIGLNSIIISEESIKIGGDPVTVQSTFTGYTGDVASTYATITNLNLTGSTLSSSISSLSGTLTSDYATIINLASTGSNLQNQINSLDNVYATDASVTSVANNLASTGNALETKIGSLSGTLTSSYATISNLALTGSNLNTKIDNFSGTYQNFVNNLDASYATDIQLQNTGSTLSQNINNLSGTLTNNYYLKSNPSGFITGVDLSSYLTSSTASSTYATINNLTSTGSTLNNNINALSGTLTSNYATITNLASTGSTLTSSINSLNSAFTGFTGNLDAIYATDTQVTSTGSTLVSSISSLSGTLTSTYATITNLASTGSTLQSNINTLTNNLNSTGSSLDNKIGSLSGTLTSTYATITNLASTGSTLVGTINSLSGTLNGNYLTTSSASSTYATIVNVSSTGVTLNNSINSLSGTLTGNYLTTSSASNTYATITNLSSTGNTLTSNLASTGSTLQTNINNLSNTYATITNLANTGSTLNNSIISLSGLFTGYTGTLDATFASDTQLANTGITLVNTINSLSGTLTGNYATILNLANTGSTLNTKINNVSGYINSSSSNIVFTTGNQTISGVKTFETGVNISGHVGIGIDNNNFGLYVRKSSAGGANPDGDSIAVFEGSGNSHITILASNSQTAGVVLGSPADNFGAYLTWNHDNNALKLGTAKPSGFIQLLTNNETEAVRITSGANVGIGTTSPSEKLQVIGNILANNLVYNTGNQTISGNKTFNDTITIRTISGTSSSSDSLNLIAANNTSPFSIAGNINLTAGTGTSPENYGNINLNAGGPKYNGKINLKGNIEINQANFGDPTLASRTINIYKTGTFFGAPAGIAALTIDNNNISINTVAGAGFGLLISGVLVTPALYATSANLASTGSTLVTNLASTGSTLNSSINSLSGTLTSNYATITNLANTGSTLQTNINNLSGYINSSSSNIVFTTGNQNISGTKTFTDGTLNVSIKPQNSGLEIDNGPFIIRSAAGTHGAVRVEVLNEDGANGFTVINEGLDLADFGLQSSSNKKINFRMEGREDYANGNSQEFQVIDVSDNPNGVYYARFGNNNIVIGENSEKIGIGTLSPVSKLHVEGDASSNSTLKVGTLELQPYSVNNAWFGDNTYYNGGFYRREAGYAGAFYFQGPEGQFRFADTDDANTTYTPAVQLKTHLDGRFGVGSDISTTTDDFTNSNFFVNSNGNVGINTISPAEKLEVVGNIKANNLVYNTGNQTISGVKTFANGSNQILNTTYSTLTGLKAISGLLSGQLYRISDFVLKWNNQSINDKTVKTAASGEPLIVTALSNKEISHLAQSETYPQDTIYYNIDATSSYSWGTINNNASIPDFKGWIYRRVDNLLNIDIPYDWRNITVNCCKPDVSSVPNYSGNYQYARLAYVKETGNNSNRGKLYYSVVTGNSGNALNNANFWSPVSDYVESGTYFATREDVNFTALYAYNDFAGEDIPIINLPFISNSRIQQPVFTSTFTGLGVFKLSNVYNIKINGGCNSVFLGDSVYNNNIGDNFYSNTIGQNTYSNDIGDNFYHNILSNGNAFNDIGDNCFQNIAMGNFSYNKINHEFFYNTIANNFYSNNIKSYFIINIIGANFQYNKIDQYFSRNLTASTFYYNNIGINFETNTIGNTFYYNTIGNIFGNNTIGNNFVSNTSEGNINGIDFTSSTHVYSGYNTILFKNAALSQRLRYFNSSDQLVVTDPTA